MKISGITNKQYSKRLKYNYTEVIFRNQLLKCDKNKYSKICEYRRINNEEYLNELKNIITFNDLLRPNNEDWEVNSFDSDLIFREKTPIIKMIWRQTTIESSVKGVDITNYIYRSKIKLNTQNFSIGVNLVCYLSGESDCWIFNRVNDYFDEYSIAIKIEKVENSQKLFANFGAFVRDNQNNLIFKIFVKEQLIDYSKSVNKIYNENDLSFIRAYITDTCDDILIARLYINDSITPNVITVNFYLPILERRRIMVAGTGEKCIIQKFVAKNADLNTKKQDKVISQSSQVLSVTNNLSGRDSIENLQSDDRNCCVTF